MGRIFEIDILSALEETIVPFHTIKTRYYFYYNQTPIRGLTMLPKYQGRIKITN